MSLQLEDENYLNAEAEKARQSKEAAEGAWRARDRVRVASIRRTLEEMANGRQYCMYCGDNEATDIEHFYPRSTYHEQTFTWVNWLLACSFCNSNRKRNRFPVTAGTPDLIDPTVEDPRTDLSVDLVLGEITARTRRGLVNIEIFDLNRDRLTRGRRDAAVTFSSLVVDYVRLVDARPKQASLVLETLQSGPFAEVRHYIKELAKIGSTFVDAEVASALDDYPEL
ncbi:HNH endonuclease [Curtobacterium sp. SGAir0471]|uniref:HNH endonuclease n=1 Tax=Curtobacterium sp. SGAir0471 TaxID=2070337 RepID=UPI0010F54002|nr:HNH endonuclease [Curtobacterium sp. SGAir0471]